MDKIKVLVSGANGKMGKEVVQMVLKDQELEYVGGVDYSFEYNRELQQFNDLEEAIIAQRPDVMVDFTNPKSVKGNVEIAIRLGVRPVVGTTGLSQEDIFELDKLAGQKELGCLVAPNFAIGAVLMMRFSQMAAKYMSNVEIIELHHDQKIDAPSGTALKTVELISKERKELLQGNEEEETVPCARGGNYSGVRIHSIRLPGLVAHQEVIFGDLGQTLSIRHDSINRESFMPGVNLAIKNIHHYTGIVYGLEHLLV